ncbi:MAG: VOC family protein [Nitrososphaerales archaeon]|jgi:4-hydroxyphenylpyruvate dioxygenase-like putative hemolysin
MARAKPAVPPGMRITQIAVVVKDLRKTMETYHRVMGWAPWSVYEHKPPVLHHTEVRGKKVAYTMLGAEVHCDPVDFEILQPLEGPSIYKEFLKEKGEGLHHVSVVSPSDDVHRALSDFERQGVDVLMSGRLGDGIEFYYMDTEPTLKMVAETVSGHAISLEPSYTYP